MKLSAQDIFDKLINEEKILELKGQIRFYLGDVDIIVKQKDVVGNIMQEWLQGWFDARGIEYSSAENSQMPPDFYLDIDNKKKNLLEVKAFNRNGSPGFDIADFRMYAEEILEKPYMLDVDYLIFGYEMGKDGIVTIKDIWLKKVWQITRRMKNYPINLQVKDGVIHKIRPGVWYSKRSTDYATFESLEDFISALEETIFKEPKLRDSIASTWLSRFQRNYKLYSGKELNIPRWNDIKDKYDCVIDKKIEKIKKEIENSTIRKEKVSERVLKLQQKLIEARTDKQRTSANDGLKKALIALEKVNAKLDLLHEEYSILVKE